MRETLPIRRKFIVFTTMTVLSIFLGLKYSHQRQSTSRFSKLLLDKLRAAGFSVSCGIAVDGDQFVAKLRDGHFAEMEFSQVLVNRVFVNIDELNKAVNFLELEIRN